VPVGREAFAPIFHAADDRLVGALPRGCTLRETATRLFTGLTDALRPGDHRLTESVTGRFLADMERQAGASARVLAQLRSHYRLGLVSNFYGNLRAVCDGVALTPFFDVIVDSVCAGCSKPDPRIFETALTALGLRPADTTFVGDSLPRDMLGARGVGMPHVWLVDHAAAAPVPCCAGDPVIHGLDELQALLP
jgi:phosphoglycolate phosphatase-like HAD superfamily hydrolase